jgi:tetratricopeptide (TPR) repeat protein
MRLPASIIATLAIACLAGLARADERYLDFINRLEQSGYHDLLVEYVERVRGRPDLPDEIRMLAEFYIGRGLLGGAEQVPDLVQRDEQLQRAATHFEKFIREQPQHDRVPEAQMSQAQILVERGRVALLQADNPNNSARADDFKKQARSSYDAARKSLADARDRLTAELKKFPAFIPEDQKRQREAKANARINVMQSHLHLGLVEYEFAQTYDRGSSEYRQTLQQAIAGFKNVSDQFSTLLGGQYALMWQGKCFEEMGELGKAEGIYLDLLKHEDREPAMQALQRQVQFFQIIVLNKRGDHVIASELADQWLQQNPRLRTSEAGLGVQFEQAKGLIQQVVSSPAKAGNKNELLKKAMNALAIVGRYDTMYKQPAIVLQQKYKGMIGSVGSALSFSELVALGDAAKDRNAWSEAAGHYSQALKLADDKLDTDQLAYLRHKLGFAYFQTKKYYESAVLSEYVARHQRETTYAAPAAHVALEAYARAFNDALRMEQSADFEEARIARLVDYVTKTWPTAAEANAARMLMGDLHLHHARYAEAGAVFESVSSTSPDYARALGRAGDAYWHLYADGAMKPPDEREPKKMAEALKLAQQNLSKSVAEQRKGLKSDSPVPLELAEAEINLAEASIESGQLADAVKLMQELAPKTQTQKELKSLELRTLIALLRGCIATKDLRAAEETMKSIEGTGKELAQITRVYLDLGKQLQAEMDRLNALGDKVKYELTRDGYVAFLNQMAARREGQTFMTLWWTGEAFFGLGMYDQSASRFGEIVKRTLADPKFLDQSKPENRMALAQAKLRYVTSMRKQRRFSEAWDQIKPLPPEANAGKDPLHIPATTNLDIIMERGLVLQDWGPTDPARLKTAIDHWNYWGQQLEKLSPRPSQYWEVRLNLLRCLVDRARKPADAKDREQRLKQAEQQLLLLTKTSTTLGGPAIKPQFKQIQQALEKELGRPIGGPAPATPAVKSARSGS